MENIDENEDIRSPDEIKVEKLIETDSRDLSEDEEIKMVIVNSIQEFIEIQKQQDKYEDLILQEFKEMTKDRDKKVNNLVNTLKKLAKFDKKVQEVFDLIENFIEAYCLGYMDTYELDDITYDKIFNELSTIRINKIDIESLKEILKRENDLTQTSK